MRNIQELKEFETKLSRLTGVVAGWCTDKEFKSVSQSFDFACYVQDTIAWVLGEITNEQFEGNEFIDIAKLRAIAEKIVTRTGQTMEVMERHKAEGIDKVFEGLKCRTKLKLSRI